MNQYLYSGPVLEFGVCVSDKWNATTFAISEKKAKSNLEYQYKKKHNKTPSSKIKLPGKIEMVS